MYLQLFVRKTYPHSRALECRGGGSEPRFSVLLRQCILGIPGSTCVAAGLGQAAWWQRVWSILACDKCLIEAGPLLVMNLIVHEVHYFETLIVSWR
jgi:hypothetical protein